MLKYIHILIKWIIYIFYTIFWYRYILHIFEFNLTRQQRYQTKLKRHQLCAKIFRCHISTRKDNKHTQTVKKLNCLSCFLVLTFFQFQNMKPCCCLANKSLNNQSIHIFDDHSTTSHAWNFKYDYVLKFITRY